MSVTLDFSTFEPIKKNKFKDKTVESDFHKVDPSLKAIAETIPATITSAYRTPETNAAVGGVPNSFHTQGKALDFRKGELGDEDRNRLTSAGFKIIPESDHEHVEPSGNAPQNVSLDFSTFEPINDPNKGLLKDDSSFLDKAASFGTGVSRSNPMHRMAESVVEGIGLPKSTDHFTDKAPGWEKGGRITGDIISSIPQYMGGMGAMKGLLKGTGLASQVAKGAMVNTAIGQGQRGFELDPVGSAIDAAAGVGGELIGAGVNKVVKSIPAARAKLFNSAFGVTPKDILSGKNLGKDIVEMGGVSGTNKSLYKKALTGLEKNETALQNVLSKVESPINRDIVEGELRGLVTKFQGQPLGEADSEVAKKLADEWVGKYTSVKTASEANQLKREIYRMLGDRPYIAENLPAKKDSLKAMARGLKKSVEDVAPEVTDLNKNLGVYGKMRDMLEKKMAQSSSGRASLMDAIQNPTFGAIGYAAGGAGGIPIAVAGREAAKSTLGKTTTAQALKYLEMLAQEAAKKGISPRYLGPVSSQVSDNIRRSESR